MKFFSFLMALFLALTHTHAEEIDVTQPIRMHQLIPRESFLIVLAVDPALPSNFVAMESPNEPPGWIYWGPEDVLKAYFKKESSLSEAIICVRVNEDVAQSKFGVLDEKRFREDLAKERSFKKASLQFGAWDEYPYCLLSAKVKGETIHVANIGLNDPSNGAILLVQLLLPRKRSKEKAGLELWDRFFQQTKKLPEPLVYKAHGQEMHIGHTIVDIAGRQVKVIAEKRKSDQKVQLVAIPENDTIEFVCDTTSLGFMAGNWHPLEPLLKIKGAYIVNKGWLHLSMVTSVLIKEVDDFSSVPLLKKNVFVKTL